MAKSLINDNWYYYGKQVGFMTTLNLSSNLIKVILLPLPPSRHSKTFIFIMQT